MKIFTALKVCSLFLFLFPLSIYGQGVIRGIISDSVTTKPLIGANVFLVGTSLGSATDLDGNYRISGIPSGSYKVRVTYIGYQSITVTVNVAGDKTISLNVSIPPVAIQGREVVVTGQAQGQTAAINQQLTSNTIVNVVSEEKIQQLPDANAAETIGRLPGVALERSGGEANKIILRGMAPQYTNVTIDGMSMASTDSTDRSVDLSTISQGTLAGIELFKAITSDQDGDAIAGTVNLVTRKAPSHRLLWLDSKGVYNKLDNSIKNQYDFNLRYGERFFNDILGVQLDGALEQRIRSNESDQYSYDMSSLSNGNDYEMTNFQLNYQNELRKRDNIGILLDIETPDSGIIKINNIYDKTSRDYVIYGRNYPSFSPSAQIIYSARDVTQNISTYNGFITGDNYLFGLTENWGLSFAQGKSSTPYDYEMEFTEPSVLDSTGKPIAGMKPIPASLHHGPPQDIISYALNNYNYAFLYDAFDRAESDLNKQSTAFLNLTKKYSFSESLSGELKGGIKYNANTKYKNAFERLAPYYIDGVYQYQRLPDGTIVPKNFAGTAFANLQTKGNQILATNFLDPFNIVRNIYGIYNLNPLLNKSDIEVWRQLNINGVSSANGSGSEYGTNDAVSAANYYIIERVSAAYLMNTLNIGRQVTFIAGLRVESENNNYNSEYSPNTLSGFPTPVGIIRDTSSIHKETNWLPNFQLLYKPLDFMNVRFAAYKALSRPSFDRRLATYIMRANGTFFSNNSLVIGNPNLMDAQAWNFEVNTSFYSNYIGLFSVSAYYKTIAHMYHTINGLTVDAADANHVLDSLGIDIKNPFPGDFDLVYQTNSTKPTLVWGFEVEHQINFWFLPGILQGLVLSYNFSIIRSQTYIPENQFVTDTTYNIVLGHKVPTISNKATFVDIRQNLEGSPSFIGNVSLGYDVGGFSARVSLFRQSQSNYSFSADGRSDVVINGFTRLDLMLKQEINDHISISLSLNNLTNVQEGESIVNRVTGWTLLSNSQRYGLTGDLGLRLTL
jgi:TonB-dependent receptor